MTALGKILAFFVLLFSLVTAGTIIVVFVTRTNWRIGFENAEKQTAAARAALSAEQERFKTERAVYEDKIKALDLRVAALERDVAGKNSQVKFLEEQRNNQEISAKKELTNQQAATTEIQKLNNERDQMVAVITTRNTHINKLEKDIVDFRNRAVQAEIQYNAAAERNQRLALKVEELSRTMDELKARGVQIVQGGGKGIPSVEVQGRVLEVSAGFATISLTRNHEIKEGDVLQVYRLNPAPLYLGTLKIIKADIDKSVGQFTPATRVSQIMKGDTVDTKVLGRQ